MAQEAFAWSPVMALGLGALAGLGLLRSLQLAGCLVLAAWLAQLIVWQAVLTAAAAEDRPEGADWNPDFHAAFLLTLMVVTPYTMIGAAVGGGLVGLAQWVARRGR